MKRLRMELPSLTELKELLQGDRLFSDYCNAFLNLPVFAKRLTYSSETGKFIIEPRVKSSFHALNEKRVWSWLLASRLPLFWSSDLFLEYRLSMELTRACPSVSADMCSVVGMNEFQKFLYGTEGEGVRLFWRDVEQLRHSRDNRMAFKVYHHIQTTYLKDDALFTLPKAVKEQAVLWSTTKERGYKTLLCRIQLLYAAQQQALDELIKYWLLRYSIHCDNKTRDLAISRDQTFSKEKLIDNPQKDETCILPRNIIFDDGVEGCKQAEREEGCKQAERVLHVHSNTNLPSLVEPDSYKKKEETKKDRKCITSMITPSTHSLFPIKCDYSKQASSVLQQLPLLPYLSAFLRGDVLAGRPFLRYTAKHARHMTSQLLFWQSVELLLIQDEMKRWSSMHPSPNPHQLVFFEEWPVARDLPQLVGLFLSGHAPQKVELPQGVDRRELCTLVQRGLGYNLLLTAQEYSAKMLFSHWQAYLLDDHHSFMDNCTLKNVTRHRLLQSMIAERNPSPEQLLSSVFDPPTLDCVWRALRYAETLKYNGIHLLPSRTHPPSLVTTPTEKEEDILMLLETHSPLPEELSPMVTTICDQLLYDWESSKVKRTLLNTKTHQYDTSNKPSIPANIMEVMKDRNQLEFFRHYLIMHGANAEMPLQFWIAIEDLKSSLDNKKAFSSKLRRIQERFFVSKGNSHLSSHPVFYELSKCDQPSIFQLIAAQGEVMYTLEWTWFKEYVNHLRAKEDEENQKKEGKPLAPRICTKGLWRMFARNVISFRHGLMNSATAEQFRNFLKEEALKGTSGNAKKVIGTKIVNVTKIVNDLTFWTEVERFKDLVDIIRESKEKGTHSPEDDIMIHKKALAIISCYIDSSVHPKIQINIQLELVTHILDSLSQGLITRGLFHEAALNIFSVLILFWKRFCIHRFAPRDKRRSTVVRDKASLMSVQKPEKKELQQFWEGGPILSFNMTTGLRWNYPQNYHLWLQSIREASGIDSIPKLESFIASWHRLMPKTQLIVAINK